MNLEAIDADFLARHLGGAAGDFGAQQVRAILTAYAENKNRKATTLSSSKSKARARKVIRCVRKVEEAVRALDLPLSPMTDADLWTTPLQPLCVPNLARVLEVLDRRRVRALLWEVAIAGGWIVHNGLDRYGWGFYSSKRPNWPLAFAVEALVQYFHRHAAPAKKNRVTCDRFVEDALVMSGAMTNRGAARLKRDYLRRVRFDPAGFACWDPDGLLPS